MTRRLLFLDILAPQPDRHASSVRSTQLLELLAEQGIAVDFAPFLPPEDRRQVQTIRSLGATPLPWLDEEGRRAFLAERGADYDFVLLAWTRVAKRFIGAARAGAPKARILFDTQDVNHLREYREAKARGNQNTLRRALATREAEAQAMRIADLTIAITEADAATLRKLVPGKPVAVVSMWSAPAAVPVREPGAPRILYVGYYGATANHDAALYLAREIFPVIRQSRPEVELVLAGADPQPEVVALAGPGIAVPGWIADLSPLYRDAGVFVAPLRFGSGLKGKMLTAMSFAMPIVASSIAAEGIGLVDGVDYLCADTAADTAAAVQKLFDDPAMARRLGLSARDRLVSHFGRARVAAQLAAALAEAEGTSPGGTYD